MIPARSFGESRLSSALHLFLFPWCPTICCSGLGCAWQQATHKWKQQFDSCHKHAFSKPHRDNHLMISAKREHQRWKTHFYSFKFTTEWEVLLWDKMMWQWAYFLLSPQGAKTRPATRMRREKGCDECSNRWDESSVLVRYALLLSSFSLFSSPMFLWPPFTFVFFKFFHWHHIFYLPSLIWLLRFP